jgi:negative regulator of sigma E activity
MPKPWKMWISALLLSGVIMSQKEVVSGQEDKNLTEVEEAKMSQERNHSPFLFRFKKECISPNRIRHSEEFYYDPELCQVMTIEGGRSIPAIESKKNKGPQTKKADIEKGEDQKDRWMWQ